MADYLMASRLREYEALLRRILSGGYRPATIRDLWRAMPGGRAGEPGPTLVVRHDIDTDPATARRLWRIEQGLGILGSWYFRRSTLDVRLMREIEAAGGEASYHYEEVADLAKRRGLRTAEEARRQLPDAQAMFAEHLSSLRARTGLPMTVVASHGDFVNRKLGVPNWELLIDPRVRAANGIELEVYDEAFMQHVTSRHSDTLPPAAWIPDPPDHAIDARSPLLYLLIHPRNWLANPRVNTIDNLRRLGEGLAYARAGRRGRPRR